MTTARDVKKCMYCGAVALFPNHNPYLCREHKKRVPKEHLPYTVLGKGGFGYAEGWLCCLQGDKNRSTVDVGELRYHIDSVVRAGDQPGRAEFLDCHPDTFVAGIRWTCGDDWYCSDECLVEHHDVLRDRASQKEPTTATFVALSFPGPGSWERDSEPEVECTAPTLELAQKAVYLEMCRLDTELSEDEDGERAGHGVVEVVPLEWDEQERLDGSPAKVWRAYCEELDLRLKIQRL